MFKRNKQKEMILTYQRVFDSMDGKKVLQDMMNANHFKTTTMTNDPYQTAFNEGARSVILRILDTCNVSIEKLEEYYKRQEELEDEI